MTDTRAATARRADAILFDLDGTLVDTAPDMVAILTQLQKDNGCEPLPYERARSHVSNGAMGLIRLGFANASEAERERLHGEYLELYERALCVGSTLFPGLSELLDRLDANSLPWGVVTNKPQRMTEPLLEQLGLGKRLACTVSGDTLPERKPHPAPLLLACKIMDVAPARTVYVGDAARDITAGRAAGMRTIAAAYGYVTEEDDPAAWGADLIAAGTAELTGLLLNAVGLDDCSTFGGTDADIHA
ncbi:MAG TPA: phosphoglycolate phosphatase [Woeseiaceae bacterium]|nr:phosphoglycolate phosphatase [Woeseiaceae bacterium]